MPTIAGAAPNTMPVRSETAIAKPTTSSEGDACTGMSLAFGNATAMIARAAAKATARPASPPAPASITLSTRNCVTSRPRGAPSATLTAVSVLRPIPRTSSRLARLAQATSSTPRAIAWSSSRVGATRSRMLLTPPAAPVNVTCCRST